VEAQNAGTQTYERNLRDIFKVQDEISAAVVDAFKLRLSSPGSQIAERRTASPSLDYPKTDTHEGQGQTGRGKW